jgi:hypothetical protein
LRLAAYLHHSPLAVGRIQPGLAGHVLRGHDLASGGQGLKAGGGVGGVASTAGSSTRSGERSRRSSLGAGFGPQPCLTSPDAVGSAVRGFTVQRAVVRMIG